jgi:hypothetical protein
MLAGGAAVVLARGAARREVDRVYLAFALTAPACLYSAALTASDLVHMLLGVPAMWLLLPKLLERVGAAMREIGGPSGSAVHRVAAVAAVALVACSGHVVARDAFLAAYASAAPIAANTYEVRAARAAGVRTTPEQGEALDGLVEYLAARTAPGEPVFAFPNEPMLYFLAERPNPTYYNAFFPNAFRPGDAEAVVEALRRAGVRYVVLRTASTEAQRTDMHRSFHPDAAPVLLFLRERFVPDVRFGEYVVLRTAGAGP